MALLLLLLLQDPMENAGFEHWTNGEPDGWTVEVGAREGSGPASIVEKGEGLVLRGTDSTRAWNIVRQSIEVKPGEHLRLAWESKAKALSSRGRKYVNHFVGLFLLDKDGKGLSSQFTPVARPDWTPDEIVLRAPENAARADVRIFLSIAGRIDIRNLVVNRLQPGDSHAVLVRNMDRYYSYFHHRGVDWKKHAAKHAKIDDLLAGLKDEHIWIDRPGKPRSAPWKAKFERNYDYRSVSRQLKDVRQIGRIGFVGRTAEGYGYAAIGSLAGDFTEFQKAVESLLDAPGLILDIRANAGGDEMNGRRIAALVADKDRVYAKQKFRAGPKHDDFTEAYERRIAPGDRTYRKPVICLTGPECMSSGEGFALMMKAIPNVTLVGRPTRGASGNPQPVPLPDGTVVWYSRWVAMDADGVVIEGKGVAPDIEVKHEGKGDPTFEAGLKELRKRIGK